MGKTRDLTGQRFGKLVALTMLDERKNNSVVWECQCDCGNITKVTSRNLVTGKTSSCGCRHVGPPRQTNIKDITGQRFGRLTALKPTEKRYNGSIVWECQCDCGNTVYVSSSKLVTGVKSSCGCLKEDPLFVSRTRDLTGQRFGRLVAIRPTEERMHRNIVWECQCDCGNLTYVISTSLRSGGTTSCGCFRKEIVSGNLMDNLVGQRFGSLIVIAPTEKRKNKYVIWQCQCDCGKVIETSSFYLKRGIVTSCGCMKK